MKHYTKTQYCGSESSWILNLLLDPELFPGSEIICSESSKNNDKLKFISNF